MMNVGDTLISQYANSPIICNLIKDIDSYIDPRKDIAEFYNVIWNLDTAEGFGLDFWGKVVGVEREVLISKKNQFTGSSLAGDDIGGYIENSSYRMNDAMFRSMIFIKALSNIIYATAPNINKLVSNLFQNRGRAYYIKNGTMMARYVFEFSLTQVERAVIISTDLLPKPTGVLVDFYEPDFSKTFGFIEAKMAPFGEGAFYIGDR